MTTTLQNPAAQAEETPSVPDLPGLYRVLTSLIPDPQGFFDSLIKIDSGPVQMTVTPRHTGQPAITLTQLPNPIGQETNETGPDPEEIPCLDPEEIPGLDPEEIPGPDPEEIPGLLRLTVVNGDDPDATVESMPEMLAREFKTAMLQASRDLLWTAVRAGRLTPADALHWDDPTNAPKLLTAAKCVFYAWTDADTVDDYLETLHQNVRQEIEKKLNPDVLHMLSTTCPMTTPTREADETPGDVRISQGAATLSQYNRSALVMACTAECTKANAGAIPWILAQPDPGAAPRHQGQLIGRARTDAMAQGMSARGWTAMTKMAPDITRMVISHCNDLSQAAETINWLASLTRSIDRTSLSEILIRPELRDRLTDPGETLQNQNLRKAAALIVGRTGDNAPSAWLDRAARHDIADAMTYAQVSGIEEQAITATSFGGLMKAVRRWHTKLNRQKIRKQWQATVNANGGTVRRWEPVLKDFEYQGITATELTSEEMLLEEALELDHCVHLYGTLAAGGTVRIFALRGPDGSRATTAITAASGTWELEQTRSRANHPAPKEMQTCARELVRACNSVDSSE